MSDVRAGMVIAGKYRIEAALARGGMGSIWRARHLGLDTAVAIKFIGAEVISQKDARRRFEREAKAAAQLQSAHVVDIHDYGVEGDVPYLVMELLDGEDLGVRLRREGRLAVLETVHVVTHVARALRRAADAGIVHRDLKPSNVFIVRGDEDEELIKVLDFGVAKTGELRVDEETTLAGAMLGSPRYMSPEQARGSRFVDPRSDLWSLAVIAYRALTGELPFTAHDVPELVAKICSETALPPSRIDPELGPEMDDFFVRALDRNPAARFQTAREMASAFAVAAGLPPSSQSSVRLVTRPPPSGDASPPPPSSRLGPDSAWRFAGTSAPPERARTTDRPTRASPPPAEPPPASSRESERTRVTGAAPAPSPPPPRPPIPSITMAEPAASRRWTQISVGEAAATPADGTLTPHPGCVDVSLLRSARPPKPPILRVIAFAALGALAGSVLVLAPWSRPHPVAAGSRALVVAVASVDAPPITSAPAAPIPEPPTAPTATTAPVATAEAAETAPAATTPPAATPSEPATPPPPLLRPRRFPVPRGFPSKKRPDAVPGR